MTETNLETALAVADAPKESRNVATLIESLKPEIEKSLQSPEGAAILLRHYYTAIRFNPLLQQCTPDSLVAALLLSAQVRLEPGPLGHVYLVPYRNNKRNAHEVVWMLGYTGIVELGRRGGATGLRASVVYENDTLTRPWENEKGVHFEHRPVGESERGEWIGAIVSWREGNERQALWMDPSRVDTAVRASRNPKIKELRDEPWYIRKTAVRFARPWLPLHADFARASDADGAATPFVDVTETGEALPVIEADIDE